MNTLQTQHEQAVQSIIALYDSPTGDRGGYGYPVFEDANPDRTMVLLCLDEAHKRKYSASICEATALASIEALTAIRDMSYAERKNVIIEALAVIEKKK